MSLSKNIFNLLAIPLVALLFSIAVAKPTQAAEFHFTDYTLSQDQTITDDVYITSGNAEINGLIQGDLSVIAENIKITGTVTGNIYAIGANISFSGNTYGNIYMIGNDITLQGIVKENAYTIGSSVNFSGNVEKDYLSIAMKTNTTGLIGDDAKFITSSGSIDSLIQGDIVIIGDKYSLQNEKVTGEIYDSTKLDSIAQEQGVNTDEETEATTSGTFNWSNKLFTTIFAFCSMSLVGYIMITSSPVKTAKIISKVTDSSKDFVTSFALGFGILIIVPSLLLVLTLSLVGIPSALFILGIILFLCFFGRLWIETALGQEVLIALKKEGYRPFKSLAIGRAISVLLNLVPFVGPTYSFVLMSTAVGAFTRMKLDYWNIGKKKK